MILKKLLRCSIQNPKKSFDSSLKVDTARAGYSFGEASALKQVQNTKVPILFMHGSLDNFVHTEMVYTLYDACPTRKALYVAEWFRIASQEKRSFLFLFALLFADLYRTFD